MWRREGAALRANILVIRIRAGEGSCEGFRKNASPSTAHAREDLLDQEPSEGPCKQTQGNPPPIFSSPLTIKR